MLLQTSEAKKVLISNKNMRKLYLIETENYKKMPFHRPSTKRNFVITSDWAKWLIFFTISIAHLIQCYWLINYYWLLLDMHILETYLKPVAIKKCNERFKLIFQPITRCCYLWNCFHHLRFTMFKPRNPKTLIPLYSFPSSFDPTNSLLVNCSDFWRYISPKIRMMSSDKEPLSRSI